MPTQPGEREIEGAAKPHRDQTDESLRVERDKADSSVDEKHEAVEEAADEVVRLARERADEVVQTARADADRQREPQSTSGEARFERERARADVVLEKERTDADAVVDKERTERRRYLADFLTVEREATDSDLTGERAHADTAIAARDEFLATVSHDLRSLLGSLALNAELLFKHAPAGASGEKMRMHAGINGRLVTRMNRLVSDLLDITSIEAGMLALHPEQVEIGQLVRDTLDAFEPVAAVKHITLDADGASPKVHAQLDGGRILQVLANLVSNAIKFTPPNGRVSIRIRSKKDEIQFSVSDTGVGIQPDALQTVFERFRQVSKDRRGLGLGLHISKCIVEAHGGRMWAESEPATGSTFHFTVPSLFRVR